MEKGYVVQGEVYAEPVLEAEVVAAEPIMGEVVGEVVPSATDHLPEALDGAPRLALVAAGSADALRFDHADVLRAGGEAPLSANGKHVGLYWPQPRNAWGHWDYIDLGCSDRVRPLRVKLELPYIIFYSREHGEFAFDVSMWQLHEGRHLVLVKACAGNPGGPTRMSKDACGRDFVLHADGTIGPRTAQHLRLGVFVPKPPAPCGPGWSAHQNIDMCGQGDVEIIHNWRATHSIEDLQRIVEQKGYSAVCVGNFGHAALKQFPYQLTAGHCKPSQGYTNTLYIWSGGGSGKSSGGKVEGGGESIDLATVARNPAAFVLILSGHHDHPACNGTYNYGGVANGKPQWIKEGGGGEKVFWTGGSWDCFWGGYSPEARVGTPVPPLSGYNEDRGGCDIKVRYQMKGGSGKVAPATDTGIDGHYFSFRTGSDPSGVVDRFEARLAGNRVTFYRNGRVGSTTHVHSATANPMESYEIRGQELHGPVRGTLSVGGDILWSHGYTSRKEGGSGGGVEGGLQWFVVRDGDFCGGDTHAAACQSWDQALAMLPPPRDSRTAYQYYQPHGKLYTKPVGRGAQWRGYPCNLFVCGEDLGVRDGGKRLIRLQGVDCCFGDGHIDHGVSSYEDALAHVRRDPWRHRAAGATFWHAPSRRLICKPKDRGGKWSRGDGTLFMWVDEPVQGGGRGSTWASGSVPALERWPTAEGGEEGGGGGLQAIAGTWVPTRLDDWRGCPVGKEARVTTYKYVVQGNGDWVDELYPSHRGHVEPAEESGLYEGYGVEPGRYPAKWRLQPNGVLVAAWGDQFNVVYYLVREGDPRTATTGGAAYLNNELNDVARNTDETHRARDLVDQGADLSSTNGAPWHHTPLHQASYHGRYAMAETLVGLGAPLHLHSNPCGRGTHGTPLELARGGGHHAIAKMLECNGGVEPVAVGGGVARQEMDRGGGGGSMSPDLLNGCWVASVCPIPFIWAIYHNQKVTDDRVRGRGCAFFFGFPIPFDEYRYRRDGTNEFVHEQDGNNVLTYDNPCCNVGLTGDKACGLITLRLCCHP